MLSSSRRIDVFTLSSLFIIIINIIIIVILLHVRFFFLQP